MSAPLSGSSGGNPTPGYYPDPSIPGYIRYWNGSSWVPGTSRPEPKEGEELPAPPSAEASSAAVAPPTPQEPAPAEETGPVFLDPAQRAELAASRGGGPALPETRPGGDVEAASPGTSSAVPSAATAAAAGPDSDSGQGAIDWDDPSRLHGRAPGTGGGWGADSAQQSGFPGQREGVSWGRDASRDPRSGTDGSPPELDASAAKSALPAAGSAKAPAGDAASDAASDTPPEAPSAPSAPSDNAASRDSASRGTPRPDGTVQMRAVNPGKKPQPAQPANTEPTVGLRRSDILKAGADGGTSTPEQGRPAPPANTEPTVGLRRSDILKQGAQGGAQGDAQGGQDARGGKGASAPPDKTVGLRRSDILKSGRKGAPSAPSADQPPTPLPGAAAQQPPQPPQSGGYGYPQQPPQSGGYGYPQQQPPQGGYGYPQQPSVPHQQGAPQQQGRQPWAQQVHDLAHTGAPGQEQVAPWRPPAADPFSRAAQQEARPASLGKRLGARVVDGLITAVASAGIVLPFAAPAVEHVQSEIDAAMAAGETRTVWLIDGTTAGPFGIVLGGLILFGLLYEVLPTARWGRTLGKKLFGLHVLTMESQEKPGFGAALKRWLTYGVLGILAIGVLNVLWCVFDRPWRQCWHDKVAGTFVARSSGEIRL